MEPRVQNSKVWVLKLPRGRAHRRRTMACRLALTLASIGVPDGRIGVPYATAEVVAKPSFLPKMALTMDGAQLAMKASREKL